MSEHRKQEWLARAALLLFAAFCAVYFLACRRFFIVAGWGFLIGFLPAWPFVHRSAKSLRSGATAWVSFAVGFAVYFSTSAFFVLWRE